MKLLLIRFSSIGDIVLTTPVIRCLKAQMPGVELHFLTKSAFQSIPAANPHISKVYAVQESVQEVLSQLKEEKYDLIIDLHDNLRSRQVAAALRVKCLRYDKQRFRRFMLTTFHVDAMKGHIVDRYFSAVLSLNVINDGRGLDLFIPESEQIAMGQLPFTHLAGYGVIVVGAGHFTKQIPLVKLEELCRQIKIPVILLGGPEDVYTGLQLESVDTFKIFNACGKYTLLQSASILQKAKYVITGDTGMMHMAAALNKRIISIWGGTDKRLGFAPYGPAAANTAIIENTQLHCRPCHKHGRSSCPKGHFNCMMDLDMQKVLALL